MVSSTPIQVTYLTIGVLALLPIYFGSFASLKVSPLLSPRFHKLTFQHPVSAPLKPKVVRDASAESSSDEDDEPTVDMVSSDDAWMFPIGGSVMLVGLYVLFKYLNKDYLNYLFTAYFGVIGIFAVSNVLPRAKVDKS
jgi:minor histocompatibility antigen H13